MGMPVITPGTGSREQAITDLIESVALQEAALSHILNAEGEKIQAVVAMEGVTPEELLMVNKSVENIANTIARLEMLLQAKLELFDLDSPITETVSQFNLFTEEIKHLNFLSIQIITRKEVNYTMANISGRIVFDRDRSATITSGDSGISNIPIVLPNITTNVRLTVLTDTNGNYVFINVPNGQYRIVESYGTTGGVASPGDFNNAM